MQKTAILLTTLWILSACANNNNVEIEGAIYMKGSVPYSYLVIEDCKSHKDYKIINPASFNLLHQQKEQIRLKAKVIKKAIGPGFPAVIEVTEVQ